MGLRRKKDKKDAIDVPMSAVIDVVFLLLIYFILTYKEEIPEAHLQVNLPQPTPPPEEIKEEPPQILEIEFAYSRRITEKLETYVTSGAESLISQRHCEIYQCEDFG